MKKLLLICFILTINLFSAQTSGKATFYHDKFEGRKTASGDIFTQSKLTCASTTYKIGTKLKITNPKNRKSVICEVNDKGNLDINHIDLSKSAFRKIGNLNSGFLKILIEKI